MIEKETRAYPGLKLRAEGGDDSDSSRRLVGYAAKFNTLSNDLNGFREKIMPGAFDRALREGADVRALINHDANLVLGRTKSGTLQLSTDSVGLRFVVFLPDTQYARDLHIAVKRGDMDQCSFAFRAVSDEWNPDRTLRCLRDVDLFDISAVTYPAYEDTSVSARNHAAAPARPSAPAPKRRFTEDEIMLINHAWNQKQIMDDEPLLAEIRSSEEKTAMNELRTRADEKSKLLGLLWSPSRNFANVQDMLRAKSRVEELRAAMQAETRRLGGWDFPGVDGIRVGAVVKTAWGCISKVIAVNEDVLLLEDFEGIRGYVDKVDIIKVMEGNPPFVKGNTSYDYSLPPLK